MKRPKGSLAHLLALMGITVPALLLVLLLHSREALTTPAYARPVQVEIVGVSDVGLNSISVERLRLQDSWSSLASIRPGEYATSDGLTRAVRVTGPNASMRELSEIEVSVAGRTARYWNPPLDTEAGRFETRQHRVMVRLDEVLHELLPNRWVYAFIPRVRDAINLRFGLLFAAHLVVALVSMSFSLTWLCSSPICSRIRVGIGLASALLLPVLARFFPDFLLGVSLCFLLVFTFIVGSAVFGRQPDANRQKKRGTTALS